MSGRRRYHSWNIRFFVHRQTNGHLIVWNSGFWIRSAGAARRRNKYYGTDYCAPFEKLELAFRNQLAQTNGVLFRRPRGTSENRIALANRTIEGDLLMVRCHYSRGSGKWRVFFASIDYRTIFVAQNRVKRDVWCSHFNQSFKSFKGEAGFCLKRDFHPTVRSTAQPTSWVND